MHKDSWIVGKDYTAAPTCATCHMSATPIPFAFLIGLNLKRKFLRESRNALNRRGLTAQ